MATFHSDWWHRDESLSARVDLVLSRSGSTISWQLLLVATGALNGTVAYSVGGHASKSGSVKVTQTKAFSLTLASGSFTRAAATTVTAQVTLPWSAVASVSGSQPAQGAAPLPPYDFRFRRRSGRDIELLWEKGPGSLRTGIQWAPRNEVPKTQKIISGASLEVDRMQANSSYVFRLFGQNDAGNSLYSSNIRVYTTPATPGKPSLSRTSAGVLIKWSDTAYYQSGAVVERSDGQSWVIGSGVGGGPHVSYLDTSVGGVGLKYRVCRFVGAAGVDTRVFGEWSPWSDSITSLSAPNKPTLVSPRGTIPIGNTKFQWEHNPTDLTEQTAAQVSYVVGSGGATLLSVGSAKEVATTFAAPGTISWQVRTKGLFSSYGAWSDVQTFRVASLPVATFSEPPATVSAPRVSVAWVTGQGEGIPQSAWEVELLVGGVRVDRAGGAGATRRHLFSYEAADNTDAVVRLRVACDGVWGEWAVTSTHVEFRRPQPPTGEVWWDEVRGRFEVTIRPGSFLGTGTISKVTEVGEAIVASSGVAPTSPTNLKLVAGQPVFEVGASGYMVTLPVSYPPSALLVLFALAPGNVDPTMALSVERSVDGGESWEPVVSEMVAVETTVFDHEGLSWGHTLYQLTAHTALGATSSIIVDGAGTSGAVWISTGDGFGDSVRLVYGENQIPQLSFRVSRDRSVEEYEGRAWGVPYVGEHLHRHATLSGVLVVDDEGNATRRELENIFMRSEETFLFRTPSGDRLYVAPDGELSVSKPKPSLWAYSIGVVEVERP